MLNDRVERGTEILARVLSDATVEEVRYSELLSDVVPAIARSLADRSTSGPPEPSDAPDDGADPSEDVALPEDLSLDDGPDPSDPPRKACDIEATGRDLESWAGRPPVIALATDGTITRIDAAPSWAQWLEPDRWVGGTVAGIDAIVSERLPDERWVGSVHRDDDADELVVLLGSGTQGRRMRVVIAAAANEPGGQTIFLASPDLDAPS